MKSCPYCSEKVREEAKKCRHCGEWLDGSEMKKAVAPKTAGENIKSIADDLMSVGYALIVLGLIVFFLMSMGR